MNGKDGAEPGADGGDDDNGGGGDERIRDAGGAMATALTLAQHAQILAVLIARGERDLGIHLARMGVALGALERWATWRPQAPADVPVVVRYGRLGARTVCLVDIGDVPCGVLSASGEAGERLLDFLYASRADVVYLGELREPEPPL